MIYFKTAFLNFLADLEVYNNREWFNANKERFKSDVEAPFHVFIERMIELLKKTYPNLNTNAKECVFRIYKDVRFSKDKTPYKSHMSAAISPGGKKDFETPGLYMEFKADKIHIYTGVYAPSTENLLKIRTYITSHLKEFDKLIHDKKFVALYQNIQGEKNKKIPAEFNEAANKQALLYNKSFFYTCEFDSELILKPKLDQHILDCYKVALPLNQFFTDALNS